MSITNKKGTSLVELIAVIVIMGIIAAIAVPTTIGVINRQKKNAAVKSAETVYAAAKTVLLEAAANGLGNFGTNVTQTPATGTVTAYSVTSAALATLNEIEKDPCASANGGEGTFTVTITLADNSFSVNLAGVKINGIGILYENNAFKAE